MFTGLFSLDIFGQGTRFWQTIRAFFMHQLFPTLLLLGLALAGALIFLGWAVT